MERSDIKIHIETCPVCESSDLVSYVSCKDYLTTEEFFTIEECRTCGFALTQDFPDEKEIGRYYDAPDYVSHSDTHKGLINTLYHWARKVALGSKAKVINRFATNKTGTLLDIGSGTGYFLNKMKSLNWNVTGIEKSEAARLYAKQKFDIDSKDSEYLYGIHNETQDVITMWHVLEHLEHLNKVMMQLNIMLKNDGIAVIALPNKDSFDAIHYREYWAAYDVPRHLWHFSPSDFTFLANKHGFKLIETRPMFFDIFYISMLSEKNKGTFLASLVGLMKGSFFFLKTLNKKEKCSSLIYVLKKNNR